jgi:hypothetical protein
MGNQPRRNDPCPCGSHKKFKKCHGAPPAPFVSEISVAATLADWPPVLFKFMERRWADELIAKGSVRIGTLADFRRAEAHDDGIVDAGEGTNLLQSGPRWTSAAENTSLPGISIEGEARGNFTLRNVTFATTMNALILCTAGHPGARGFPSSYDTVVEIVRPRDFIDCVTGDLRRRFPDLRPLGFAKCVYVGRDTVLDPGVYRGDDSWIRKPRQFEPQAEYRAAWSTRETVDPINLVVPGICNFVRIRPTDRPADSSSSGR